MPDKCPNLKNVISTADAAEILGVSPIRVRQFIDAGRLHAVKVGRDYAVCKACARKLARSR
jgi:excisionase family DNA binding protein